MQDQLPGYATWKLSTSEYHCPEVEKYQRNNTRKLFDRRVLVPGDFFKKILFFRSGTLQKYYHNGSGYALVSVFMVYLQIIHQP